MLNNNDRVNLQIIFVPVVFSFCHVVTESKENLVTRRCLFPLK